MANPKKIDYYVLLQTRKHPIFKVDDWFQKFGNVKRQKLKKLFAAQNGLCFYCENPMRWVELEELQRNGYRSKGLDVTLDHKIPKSRGGTDSLNNLVACCSTCNNRKGDVSFEKFVENHKLDLREKSLEDVRLEVDDKDLIFKAIEALYGPIMLHPKRAKRHAKIEQIEKRNASVVSMAYWMAVYPNLYASLMILFELNAEDFSKRK